MIGERQDGDTTASTAGPDSVDLDSVDLFAADFHTHGDPHRVWAAMRERAPLHRQVLPDGRAFWSVTRYADVCRVLAHHDEFTSERGTLLAQLGHGDAAAGRMLVATDPPRHDELRRPLAGLFTRTAVAATERRIRSAVRAVLVTARPGEPWDVAREAMLLPMVAAGALMDVPEAEWAELARLSGMAVAPEDPVWETTGDGEPLSTAHYRLFEFFVRQVRERSGTPGDDVIRRLMSMRVDGTPLTREEIVTNCYSVLLGANATTPYTVAGTVQALTERPEQYRAVRNRPGGIPALVEEGLRWTSAGSSFLRYAVRDVRIGGGRIRAGDAVVAWVGAANRDREVFHDPDSFLATRTDNRHLAFGFGPHYCLGAAVVRLTLRVFFEEAAARFEAFGPAGPFRRVRSNFILGFSHLPVSVRLSTAAGR